MYKVAPCPGVCVMWQCCMCARNSAIRVGKNIRSLNNVHNGKHCPWIRNGRWTCVICFLFVHSTAVQVSGGFASIRCHFAVMSSKLSGTKCVLPHEPPHEHRRHDYNEWMNVPITKKINCLWHFMRFEKIYIFLHRTHWGLPGWIGSRFFVAVALSLFNFSASLSFLSVLFLWCTRPTPTHTTTERRATPIFHL